MEEFAWLMLVATPLLASAGFGLLFTRAWQRVLFTGLACAGLYAAAAYSLSVDMTPHVAEPSMLMSPPHRTAIEVALVMLPIGLCAGFVFHLFTRFIRTNKA